MFPRWYAALQPDWPAQLHVTDFPLWDEGGSEPLPEEIEAFLQAGTPPVVIAPGSANVFAKKFFEIAVAACRRAGYRAMLMSRFRQHLPMQLPNSVAHFEYASFAQLLPRARGIVHHGGVGTTARGLASGIPQIVHPLSHDQFDNAQRVMHLGCGRRASGRYWQPENLAPLLTGCLESTEVAAACRAAAGRFHDVDPFAASCDVIEQYVARRPSRVAV